MMNFKLGADIVKDNKIEAVHDDDLIQLLKSLNIYSDVVNGKCKCLFCKSTITIDNIDAIVPHKGKVCFTCDKDSCHERLILGGK